MCVLSLPSSHPSEPSEPLLQSTASLEPTGPVLTSTTYNDSDIDYRGGGRSKYGWNDPPVKASGQTPNRPAPSRSVTGEAGWLWCSDVSETVAMLCDLH